jgi:hypothetical protein
MVVAVVAMVRLSSTLCRDRHFQQLLLVLHRVHHRLVHSSVLLVLAHQLVELPQLLLQGFVVHVLQQVATEAPVMLMLVVAAVAALEVTLELVVLEVQAVHPPIQLVEVVEALAVLVVQVAAVVKAVAVVVVGCLLVVPVPHRVLVVVVVAVDRRALVPAVLLVRAVWAAGQVAVLLASLDLQHRLVLV